MAAISDFDVKKMSELQTGVRISIIMVDLPQKVFSYVILGVSIKMFIFQDGAGGHL